VSADSYGFVLLLIIASYVLSVTVASDWGASAVVFIQIGTAWFALRTAQARRPVRRAAFVLMARRSCAETAPSGTDCGGCDSGAAGAAG